MNTTDLGPLIRECVDAGAGPITIEEITGRPARAAQVRHRGRRLGLAASGLAAAGLAGALVASQGGGAVVLTAATVRHISAASATAMTSGQASIDWVSAGLPSVGQDISFDGADWNDVINPGVPTQIHQTSQGVSWTGESVSRVVDGQLYRYPGFAFKPAPHPVKGWMRIDAAGAAQGPGIPDPRTLLSVLSPSAGFVSSGEHLHATTPGAVSLAPLDPIIQSEPDNPRVTALDLWVDSADVVQKAVITVSGTGDDGSAQSVTVTVTFSQIGQPQDITAPAQFTVVGGK